MDIREITDGYAVSPQIGPEDFATLAAAGFTAVLCNRPDMEVPPDLQSAAMEAAAKAHGLTFVVNPLVHGAMTEEIIALQRQTLETETKTLAYCASGTRSTICWMLGQAQGTPPEDLIQRAAEAGYQLAQLYPHLAQIHQAAQTSSDG